MGTEKTVEIANHYSGVKVLGGQTLREVDVSQKGNVAQLVRALA